MDLGKLGNLKSEDNGNGGGKSFTTDDKKIITPGDNIVRILGKEFEWVWRTWIKCDDGKPRPFNLTEESILWDLVNNTVLTYDLVDDPTKTGKKIRKYRLEETYPNAFRTIFSNGSTNPNDSGWAPSRTYLFNCIDRESNWCQLNKHTRLLVKTKSEIGIGQMALNAFADVVEEYGNPLEYDVNFTKKGTGQTNTKYGCVRANPDPEKHKEVVTGDLTDEEIAYQIHDLKKLTQPSKSFDIIKYLGNTIAAIDKEIGSDFIKQFQADGDSSTPTPSFSKPVQVQASASNVTQGTVTKVETKPIVQNQFVQNPVKPDEQVEIKGTKKQAPAGMNSCPTCGEFIPEKSKFCSNCGEKFEIS